MATKLTTVTLAMKHRIFTKGDIIKKINDIDVNNIISATKAFKKPLVSQDTKYIKIETSNKKVFILSLKQITDEEQFLSNNHNYKIF